MSRIIPLTKVLLKTGFDFGINKSKITSKKDNLKYLIILAFMPLFFMAIKYSNDIYKELEKLNQQGLILELGFYLCSIMIFMFGILYVMSIFYFSMDINRLLPLPLKPSEILLGKFIVTLIYEYSILLFIAIPVIGVYGVNSGEGILYYLYSIIIYLSLPILPLVVVSIIVMIIMRFTNLTKNKDLFRVISGVIGLTFALGLNIIIRKIDNNEFTGEKIIELLNKGNNSLIGLYSKFFPTSKYGALTLVNSNNIKGISNLIIFITITAISILVFVIIGDKTYFKGVLGVNETQSTRKELSKSELNKATEKSSAILTYMLKEIRVLLRTPSFLLNCVVAGIISPIFILVILIVSDGINITLLQGYFMDINYYSEIFIISTFVSIFFSTANNVSVSSISRDGNNFYVNKFIPLNYNDLIKAKLLPGLLISFISLLITNVVFYILFKPAIILIIAEMTVAILGIIAVNIIGIYKDIKTPKLDWENEQKVVKNNMNVFLVNILTIFVCFILALIGVKLDLSLSISFLGLTSILIFIDLTLYKMLITKGAKLISELEV